MKLSEAIRLGAMLRPQAFGKSFDGVGTCAWGAADEAMGMPVRVGMEHDKTGGAFRPEWNWAATTMLTCPACHQHKKASNIISEHLNDTHRWTRERIADWVATIEPQDAPTSIEQPIAAEAMK